MGDTIGNLSLGITADNKVEKGAKEAEKRLGQIPKRISQINNQASKEAERSFGKSSKSILGSLAKIEQASARVFGGRSLTAGLSGSLKAVGEAGTAMGDGLGAAAAAGGVLAETASIATLAVGATVGVLGAAGFAAYKLADSWAKAGTQIKNTATVFGLGTKTLQAFSLAAEGFGVDRASAAGGLNSLSETLNDARYGRNTGALLAMRRAGIKMQTNKDGTVNIDAMLPSIANAMQHQNTSGRRTLAKLLGIPLDVIPEFSQGGKTLAAAMSDAQKHGPVYSDQALTDAGRINNTDARLGQIIEKGVLGGQHEAALKIEPILSSSLRLATKLDDNAGRIASAAESFSKATDGFGSAVDTFTLAVNPPAWAAKHLVHSAASKGGWLNSAWRGLSSYGGDLADRIEHLGERSRQDQVSRKGAAGVMQLLPATARMTAEASGIPWDEHRFRTDAGYNRELGRRYLAMLGNRYGKDDVLTSAAYNAGPGRVDDWVRRFGDPRRGQISDAEFAARIPFKETRDYVHRVGLSIEFKNAPKGTKAKATGAGAVSYAMQN